MGNLKNIKSFDIFFESMNSNLGSFLNESATEEEKQRLMSSPQYRVFMEDKNPDNKEEQLIDLILEAMRIVPGRISIAFKKDLENDNIFLKKIHEVIMEKRGVSGITEMYDILFNQITVAEDTDLLEAMADCESKDGVFGKNFIDYLNQKDPEFVEVWQATLDSTSGGY
jgi:hypothetical protein